MKKLLRVLYILPVLLLCLSLCACNDLMDFVQEVVQQLEDADLTEQSEGTNADKQSDGTVGRTTDKTEVEAKTGDVVLADGELSFHFITLGNAFTGDCTYVKIGDMDILIDAGSIQDSAPTIIKYVSSYCTDGKLEYVIATHAHKDHIAGFVGPKVKGAYTGVFRAFEIGTIIEFARTNATSSIYPYYCDERDAAVERGATCYTALDCWKERNGAQRSYVLAENVTMDVLYQCYYEEDSSDENNYSVCVLFNYGDSHYLFTGDLEKEGEASLVQENNLPHCKLYKAGHHGSKTSSTTQLLQVIQPDVVCVCCCCGSTQYTKVKENTFPTQDFFDRVLPYTDQIFATSMVEIVPSEGDEEDDDADEVLLDMNGNIVVVTDGDKLDVHCSASATPVPQTAWFAANRTRAAP